jgi:CheY-like chemotaxis protein
VGLFVKIRSFFSKRKPAAVATTEPAAVEVAQTAEQAITDRRRNKRRDARRGTRVLIIDDSTTVIAVLKRFLTSVGYVTYEALDAERGLELARTHRPELIFLDIILPGMDGFAALRHIRRDPLIGATPVIMISGNEQAAEQFYANRIGADDFMKKPFKRPDVFIKIEPLLDDQCIPRHIKRH